MLNLPALRFILRLRLSILRGGVLRTKRPRNVEIRQLAEKRLETLFLGGPVNLGRFNAKYYRGKRNAPADPDASEMLVAYRGSEYTPAGAEGDSRSSLSA